MGSVNRPAAVLALILAVSVAALIASDPGIPPLRAGLAGAVIGGLSGTFTYKYTKNHLPDW